MKIDKIVRYIGSGMIGAGIGLSIGWLSHGDFGLLAFLPAILIVLGIILRFRDR